MRLFSYVVARDYGFAPNPFFGACTLATCKPRIRSVASVGDWVIGTGSSSNNKRGFLVFAMRISEALTFNEYWEDTQFRRKRPNLKGSKKQAFGDNIYFRDAQGQWRQRDSHHSYHGGAPNLHNIKNDTQTNRVLLGLEFAYWGSAGPKIPQRFRNYDGLDICAARNHKSQFPDGLVNDFVEWFRGLDAKGYLGAPLDWVRTP